MLGGTTYAAATIGAGEIKKDAVRSRHVKEGAVKSANLGTNSVGTDKVLDGTLLKQDFQAGQIPPAVPPTEPIRLVKEPTGTGNCPAATGEFCLVQGPGVNPRWANFGNGYAPAAFYKDRSGIVHLQGSIEGTFAAAFVLPPGYRPTGGDHWFGVWNSEAESDFGAVKISADGTVQPEPASYTTYLSLDGIQFRP
ncbi:MAG TPA: hypothetical protein VD790_04785 [Thermoleophilaceae bacterium]|nr:hypothetical protein [Thermoleophilaceae bacterium]